MPGKHIFKGIHYKIIYNNRGLDISQKPMNRRLVEYIMVHLYKRTIQNTKHTIVLDALYEKVSKTIRLSTKIKTQNFGYSKQSVFEWIICLSLTHSGTAKKLLIEKLVTQFPLRNFRESKFAAILTLNFEDFLCSRERSRGR